MRPKCSGLRKVCGLQQVCVFFPTKGKPHGRYSDIYFSSGFSQATRSFSWRVTMRLNEVTRENVTTKWEGQIDLRSTYVKRGSSAGNSVSLYIIALTTDNVGIGGYWAEFDQFLQSYRQFHKECIYQAGSQPRERFNGNLMKCRCTPPHRLYKHIYEQTVSR